MTRKNLSVLYARYYSIRDLTCITAEMLADQIRDLEDQIEMRQAVIEANHKRLAR